MASAANPPPQRSSDHHGNLPDTWCRNQLALRVLLGTEEQFGLHDTAEPTPTSAGTKCRGRRRAAASGHLTQQPVDIPTIGKPPVPIVERFDPFAPEFLADPFAFMAGLPPVFFAPSLGYYVVSRYKDVEQVFTDPESFSAAPAQLPLVPLVDEAKRNLFEGGHRPQPSIVSLDPPAHTRLRAPTARAFTPKRVADFEPRIRETAQELLDRIDAKGPFDVVAALTQPLPLPVIFRFLGVPRADWERLGGWCGNRLALGWGRPTPDEQIVHSENMAAYRTYLRGLVAARASEHGDDFCSALLQIHDEAPQALTHEEIASILFSLSFAGHETTSNLIGNTLRRLLEESARWDAVVADASLISGVVDEVLRYDPSVVVWRRQTR